MRRLRALLLRLIGAFRSRGDDIDAELESHLALHVDDNIRAGMTPEAARRAALLALGGVIQTREAYGDRRGIPFLEHLVSDVRVAVRTLRKSPGFTLVVILTLALGIGANAAIFSIVNAVLLRPFAYPDADRLVTVRATNGRTGWSDYEASYPDFEDWKAQNRSFETMVPLTMYHATIVAGDHAEQIGAIQVAPGFFETLGYRPQLGRTFQAVDQEPDARVVILSDPVWTQQFGRRPDIVGRTMTLNGQPHTIIGVMGPEFDFTTRPRGETELFQPLTRDASFADRSRAHFMVLARLRAGVSVRQAQADLDVITRRLATEYPATNAYTGAHVLPLAHARVGHVRENLLIFMGVVAIVLLIACTNVANLLLARNVSRRRELAVRAVLGAGRLRLLQHLITESLVLALAGGIVGLLVAIWIDPLIVRLLAQNFTIARLETTRVDASVFAFTFAVSLATVLLFGGVHAQGVASTVDLQDGLRVSGRAATDGPRGPRLRRLLVIVEVAMALTLLAGAGALLRSVLDMQRAATGFVSDHVLTLDIERFANKSTNVAARQRYYRDLLARVATLPQTRSAAVVSILPLDGWRERDLRIIGRPAAGSPLHTNSNIVSEDYFRTMGIPLKAGRAFLARDTADAPAVAVINETAARRFWPDEDPIGAQIALADDPNRTLVVVGIVGDVRQMGLDQAAAPEIFQSTFQQTGPMHPRFTLVVRTTTDPASLAAPVMALVRSVDREVPIEHVYALEDRIDLTIAHPRVYALLLGVFALLALLLAIVGLYGVMSYTVSQRTHEMGIRMALGADRGDVIRLMLRQALGPALIGTAAGVFGAIAVSRVLTSLIPSAKPADPLTLMIVAALLLIAAATASYGPARRGSRVDPMRAIYS